MYFLTLFREPIFFLTCRIDWSSLKVDKTTLSGIIIMEISFSLGSLENIVHENNVCGIQVHEK